MFDDLAIGSSLSIVVKKMNNRVDLSERRSFRAVETLSASRAIRLKREGQRTLLFSRQNYHAKLCGTYVF